MNRYWIGMFASKQKRFCKMKHWENKTYHIVQIQSHIELIWRNYRTVLYAKNPRMMKIKTQFFTKRIIQMICVKNSKDVVCALLNKSHCNKYSHCEDFASWFTYNSVLSDVGLINVFRCNVNHKLYPMESLYWFVDWIDWCMQSENVEYQVRI